MIEQAKRCIAAGLISEVPPVVARLESEADERKAWRESLSKVTVGAVERV